MEERHNLRKEATHSASRSAKGTWVPPGQLTASPHRDKAPREEQHGLKAAAGAQRSQPYSNSRVKAPAAAQSTPNQAGIPASAAKCRDASAAAKSRSSSSSGGGSSSAGGQGYSSNQQHQQNSTSSYTAALLKRQAAAALQNCGPGSPRGAATAAHIITGQGSTLHIHQQQEHGTDSLAALATKLQGMGGYSSRSAATVAAADAAGSPRSGNTSPRQRQQQQQEQQHALNVCNGSRHSSTGSGSSASSGSYAAQASSRSALLSARGAVTHRTSTDGQYTCTTVTANQQQQQQQSAAGMGAYSQQLSSALTALSAVTAANTAAAAMLRAVATEAAKTAGAVSVQHAGTATGSSHTASYNSSSIRTSSSLQQEHPVVPPLQLNPQQQQQQELYQPVSTRIRLAAAQAVARIDGSYQRAPAAAVASAEISATSATAQAAAAGGSLPTSSTAAAAAVGVAAFHAAGVTLPTIKTITAAAAAAAGSGSTVTEDFVETTHSPAGGIGYSKLRRLHTTSCAGSAAAGGSPRHGELPEPQPLPAAAAVAAAAAAPTSSEGTSSASTLSGLSFRQQQQQQQQQLEEGGAGDQWTSEDVVMGWYQYSDDYESTEQMSSLSSGPAACTAAAAAGGGSPYHTPGSPGLSFQQPFGSSQTVAAAAAAAAGTRLLTTSSSGIEYAKLLRTQTGSPAATPRQTRFQQQQQQQQQGEVLGSSPAGGMGFRKSSEDDPSGFCMSSKLVTGWYGSGLHSIGSESSCGNSPEPCYADPQQQTHGMCSEVPHACGTVQYSMSSGGGAVPAAADVARAPAVRAGGTDSSGGWSSDGLPGWGLAPYYPTVLSTSHAGGSLTQAVGATLGITAQDTVLSLPQQGLNLHSSSNPGGIGSAVSAGVSRRGGPSGGTSRTGGGGTAPLGGSVGTFDLRPCVGAPLLSTRNASVTELLEASQAQINCMEGTLVSMLQVAKRWTEGGMCERGMEESLRERFSSTF